jgi:hypothetical protein
MTGRYCLIVPQYPARNVTWERPWQTTGIERQYEEQLKGCWHRFNAICRSLHGDGLHYDVQFNLNAEVPHVLVMASGKAKPRKQPVKRALSLPPPIPPRTCHERRLEVEWFLPENRERRNSETAYWRRRWGRHNQLAAMAEEQLRAELEYWQKLEALTGLRQHYKPGLTDETAYLDDEVAA